MSGLLPLDMQNMIMPMKSLRLKRPTNLSPGNQHRGEGDWSASLQTPVFPIIPLIAGQEDDSLGAAGTQISYTNKVTGEIMCMGISQMSLGMMWAMTSIFILKPLSYLV